MPRNKCLVSLIFAGWEHPMPLIVDTFDVPAALIAQKLFQTADVVEIESLCRETVERILAGRDVFCVHRECVENVQEMRYYFNEVVEVLANVRYINKNKKSVRYYLVGKNGDGVAESVSEIRECERTDEMDKTAFLPHVRAQGDEIVIFPDDE